MEFSEFKCKICEKYYKSYQSLWNHVKKYHSSEGKNVVEKCDTLEKMSHKNTLEKCNTYTDDNRTCKFCKKQLCDRKYRWKHEKICKFKEVGDNKINKLEKQIEQLKTQISEKSTKQINNCNIVNGNVNTGPIFNLQIVPLGKEKLTDVLTEKQKMSVLNSYHNPHIALTDLIFTDPNLEKYRNVYVTNLANDIAYIFDDKKNQYIVKSKKNIINNYSNERIWDIENFLSDLSNKLDDSKIIKLQELINDYFKDDGTNDKIKKEILFTLYNNKVKVKKIYESINEIEL
jgi:hypothetical protein